MNDTIIFVDVGFLNKLSKHFGDGKYLKFNQESFFKNIAKNQNLCLKINSKFSISNHLIDSCDEVFQITKQDMINNLLK